MAMHHSPRINFRIIYYIGLILCSALNTYALPPGDTLIITGTGISWDFIQPGLSYTCIADTPGIGTNISPGGEICRPVYLKQGIINITGTPGTKVLLNFILPTKLYPSAASGEIVLSYRNQSAAVLDINSGRPAYWFNPAMPDTIILDTTGRAQIWLVADVSVPVYATDGDYFGNAIVEVLSPKCASADTIGFKAFMTPLECIPTFGIDSFNPIIWSELRSGINYTCTADTIDNIQPLDPENPEILKPVILTVVGEPNSFLLLKFFSPDTLKSRSGPGYITLSYDSATVTIIDPLTQRVIPNQWNSESNSFVVTPNIKGRAEVHFSGNPSVSSDVIEGDTLSNSGIIMAGYIWPKSSRSSCQHQEAPFQFQLDYEPRAIIRRNTTNNPLEEPINIPKCLALYQNHPNPFNPVTRIRYQAPVQSEISLKIYNVLGMEVASLADGTVNAGTHAAEWDASGFPSGVYFCRLHAGNFTEIKKLLLLR
jgi:hypothetical protein